MNIRFYKRGNCSALDGQVTHRGCRYRFPTHIKVEKWNARFQKSGVPEIDRAVKILRTRLESQLNEFSSEQDIRLALAGIDGRDIKAGQVIRRTTTGNVPATFSDFFKEFSSRSGRKQAMLGYNVIDKLVGTVTWDEVDDSLYIRVLKAMTDYGARPNYQGDIIKRLKAALNEALAFHYTNYDGFRRWKKPSEETFSIALTQEEVDALWSAELEGKDSAVRDLFIIGIYTAARFSDYSRLTTDNIVGDKLSFSQVKTGGTVLIPCSEKIRAVLERNGGRAPQIIEQVFNRNIKAVCRKVGMTGVVQVPDSTRKKLRKADGEPVMRYELVSSHTARRTGATLLYKAGVPIRVCRYLTGHTNDSTFLKYIKIDKEEAADMLAKEDFFA